MPTNVLEVSEAAINHSFLISIQGMSNDGDISMEFMRQTAAS